MGVGGYQDLAQMRTHATAQQWEYIEVLLRHGGNTRTAGAELGVSRSTIRSAMKRVRARFEANGVAVDDATLDHIEARRIPGTSVLTKTPGGDTVWVKNGPAEAPDPAESLRAMMEVAADWAREGPHAWSIRDVEPSTHDDLMVVYGFGDPHLGLLCWEPEVGHNWNTKIGKQAHIEVMRRLVSKAPPAPLGVVVWIGDNTHNNDQSNVTPRSRHQLDVDGRFPHLKETAMMVLAAQVELALIKHERVRVVIIPGNHDPEAARSLRLAIHAWFRKDDAVEVEPNHSLFTYWRFGACQLGAHHGHTLGANKLGRKMLRDQRWEWRHGWWFKGHTHGHAIEKDEEGVVVVTLPTLVPADSYAHENGYHSMRGAAAHVFHKERGRVGTAEEWEPVRPDGAMVVA